MKLFRSKVWSIVDIALLKWSCVVFGIIAGAYFAVVLLAIKPAISYFMD